LYTQSAGRFDWEGGIAKATNHGPTDNEDGNDGLLAYWSLAATVAFTILVYCLEGSLDARQKRAYQKTEFPQQLATTVAKIDAQGYHQTTKAKTTKMDGSDNTDQTKGEDENNDDGKPLLQKLQDKFKSAQTYGLDKINFGMFASTYDTLESVTFLLVGFLPYTWDLAVQVGKDYFGYSSATDHEIKISLIFLLIITLVGTITSLPFELYSTFCIEKRHGFNKQTYGLFFSDKIKSLFLTFAIGGPFVALLLKIIKVRRKAVDLYVFV
jgi:STE24 endopeptidase